MGIRRANVPIYDSYGQASGIIKDITFIKKRTELLRFEILVNNTNGPTPLLFIVEPELQGRIVLMNGKDKKITYNYLTDMVLALGLAKPEEVEGIIPDSILERVEGAILGLKGKLVKFRFNPYDYINNRPVPSSFKVVS